MKQLSLFAMEERAAIAEFHGGASRRKAEQIAGFPYTYRGAENYLLELVQAGEPLIHLGGENPHICKIRTFSSYEPEICKQRAWIDRGWGIQALSEYKYTRKGTLDTEFGRFEIWHFEGPSISE